MRKRMKKIAMLLSAAMLINSMDGAVMVSATDMTEVIEESTGVAEESIEEDSEDISADDETGEGEADLQDEEIILEEAAGETEDEEFIIEEQEDIQNQNISENEVMALSEDTWDIQYEHLIDAPLGTSVTLSVKVEQDPGTLKYQWYDDWYGGKEIEGATSAEYQTPIIKNYSQDFYCLVTNTENEDDYKLAMFIVSGTKSWSVGDRNSKVNAPIGEETVLTVPIENDPGTLEYQWYISNKGDQEIEGATGSSYKIVAENKEQIIYKCKIVNTTNIYEEETEWFYVTGTEDYGTMKCWITGDYDRDREESWSYAEFHVKVDEPLKLNIYAVTNRETAITYEWYRGEASQEDYDWKRIDGADTGTYAKTMAADDAGAYKCIVSDGKTVLEKVFRVYAESRLEYESYVRVRGSLFNNTILEAKATSDNGPISYKWFQGQDYDKNGKVLGTEQTLEIEPNEEEEEYQCYITDGKDEGWIDFTVLAEKISIEAPEIVVVPKGEKATITVSAAAYKPGEELHYEWGIYNWDGLWTEPGSDTFLTENIDTFKYYVCEVSSESCGSRYVKIIVIADDLADKLPKDLDSAVLVPSNGATKIVCINGRVSNDIAGKLIPDQSGVWKISTDSSADMAIYDSEMKKIAEGHVYDDNGLGCYLEAGKVYYIGIAEDYQGYDLYTVTSQYLGNGGIVDEWHTEEIKTLPTCTETGKRKVWSDEFGMYIYDFPIPALGHISDEKWTVDKEANCGEAGDRYRTCSRCGEIYHETIPATGNHKYTTWTMERAATCTADGVQSRSCTECGWKEEQVLAKTGHRFGDYVVTQEPTVLAEGVKTRTCSVCGQTENATVSRLTGSISLTASTRTLKNNGTTRLADIVTGLNRGDYIVSYVSTNPAVATVDSAGNVTGHAAGTANIIITTASGASATVKITVEQTKKVATTKLKASSVKLSAGQQKKLTVTVTPKNATDKVTYTSANKKIATVSADGTITGKKAGKTKITVKSGKKKVTVTVTVTKRVPTGITGIPTEKILKKGKTLTLKAKLVPTGAEAKVKYKSSNKKVATVSAKGKVKAKKAGTAVITITAGKVKTTCKITVK